MNDPKHGETCMCAIFYSNLKDIHQQANRITGKWKKSKKF